MERAAGATISLCPSAPAAGRLAADGWADVVVLRVLAYQARGPAERALQEILLAAPGVPVIMLLERYSRPAAEKAWIAGAQLVLELATTPEKIARAIVAAVRLREESTAWASADDRVDAAVRLVLARLRQEQAEGLPLRALASR